MGFTYLLVFNYTKDKHAYFSNMTATLRQPFSEDDKELYEEVAKTINNRESHLINIIPIEASRKSIKF